VTSQKIYSGDSSAIIRLLGQLITLTSPKISLIWSHTLQNIRNIYFWIKRLIHLF